MNSVIQLSSERVFISRLQAVSLCMQAAKMRTIIITIIIRAA